MPTGAESSLRGFGDGVRISRNPKPRTLGISGLSGNCRKRIPWQALKSRKYGSGSGFSAGLQFRILVSWPIPVTSSYLGRPGLQTSSLG